MENKNRRYIYEWLEVGLCLCFVGGFLDAYTFISRGEVFANAQTGNIILLVIRLAQGEGVNALRYLIPIVFFIAGVFLSEVMNCRGRKGDDSFIGHCGIIFVEIVILLIVALLPLSVNDMIANALVSFAAAIQFNSFRKMEGLPFATAFCTGNLRSSAEYLYHSIADKDKNAIKISAKYFLVILMFALGVLTGCYLTWEFGVFSVLFMCGLLLLLLGYMITAKTIRYRKSRSVNPTSGYDSDSTE